jgi:hypothetical protein
MSVVIAFVAAPILLVVALAVRFAGNARILNTIDYSRIAHPAALHRWAGNRLLLLPLFSVVIGLLCFHFSPLTVPLMIAFAVGVIAVAIWVAAGSARFSVNR